MKSVVDWVLARPYRLILLAVVFAPLVQILSAALVALETAKRGAARGLLAAAAAMAGVAALALASHASWGFVGGIGAGSLAAGVVLGLLLRAGGLRLAFQGAILLAVLAVLGLGLGVGSAEVIAPVLDRLAEILKANGATTAQLQTLREAAPLVFGLLAAFALADVLAALFLADWWLGLAEGERRFGAEFRDLKLGRVLGVPATLIVVIGLVLNAPVVQNLSPLALFGFLFQGLSVMHAWVYAKQWHPIFVAPVYVLLFSPLIGFAIFMLGGIGLMDNWFDLRAPLRRRG